MDLALPFRGSNNAITLRGLQINIDGFEVLHEVAPWGAAVNDLRDGIR